MGVQVAVGASTCRCPARAANRPCRLQETSAADLRQTSLVRPARRNSKRRSGHQQAAVAFQAPQQQQVSAVDDAQCSRKLGRFSAQADVKRSLLNFTYEVEVDAGTLVIQPLAAPQLREVTDLLTDVFETSGDPIGLYTGWMRGQIRQYLELHITVVRDAVVLVAVLLPRQAGSGVSKSSTAGASAAQQVTSSGNGSSSSSSSSSGDVLSSQQGELGTPAACIDPQPQQQQEERQDQQQQQQQRRRLDADAGVLVGTVEMSFTDTTRTRFLTLNPPKDSAYLGNMCTAPAHRRRGYGLHLVRAAEQLTRLAGYPIIYLHLRFRDVEAAAMYERAGYTEVKRDMFLLPLIGYRRRFLMSKNMPLGRR